LAVTVDDEVKEVPLLELMCQPSKVLSFRVGLAGKFDEPIVAGVPVATLTAQGAVAVPLSVLKVTVYEPDGCVVDTH
jgi:hypothetical protein